MQCKARPVSRITYNKRDHLYPRGPVEMLLVEEWSRCLPGRSQLWCLTTSLGPSAENLTHRGVLGGNDLAGTTVSSEVAPLFLPLPGALPRVLLSQLIIKVVLLSAPPDPSVTSGWVPRTFVASSSLPTAGMYSPESYPCRTSSGASRSHLSGISPWSTCC